MKILEIETGHDIVKFYDESLYTGPDFFIKSSCPLDSVKYCFFFDSRAISGSWERSLLQMLLNHFSGENWLAITRPLNLTIWPTLLNFLYKNKINPDLLITNVGLVDFTPKKKLFVNNMIGQTKFFCPDYEPKMIPMEEYGLSDGTKERLFTLEYNDVITRKIKNTLSGFPVLTIKSPLVDSKIEIERKRPQSFFSQLVVTNNFIDELGFQTINPGIFDTKLTYDAVHWTRQGNELIFNKILENL